MERHIPKIVGSWLGGTYDRDRAVARAANDGTKSFLDTPAKMALLYRRCEASILDYAQEAVEETAQTLSDERTMSADDMQAKYFRVIGSSISLISNLLSTLDTDAIHKHREKYEGIVSGNKKLWAFASCDDAFVRRATDQLMLVCLAKLPTIIESDLEFVSHSFIAEALKSSQTTSAFQLLSLLVTLTSKYPEIWTSSYKAKKGPLSRLRAFVAKGSQGGPPDYWIKLGQLVLRLPDEVLPSEPGPLLEFLDACRRGASNREEPRMNADVAWATYFSIMERFITLLPPGAVQEKLLPKGIFPIFGQYLFPAVANETWVIGANTSTLAKALTLCWSSNTDKQALDGEWARLEKEYSSKILTSLPEQSKDYNASQAAVIALSHRWFKLVADVLKTEQHEVRDLLVPSSQRIITTCLGSITSRNGKPYSAAATVETALRLAPALVEDSPETLTALETFLEQELLKLVLSPSGPYLISILNLFRILPYKEATFERIWQSTLDGLLALPEDGNRSQMIAKLIASEAVSKISQENPGLQEFLVRGSTEAIQGNPECRSLFEAAIAFDIFSADASMKVLNQVLAALDARDSSLDGSLESLEFISKNQPSLLNNRSNIHVILITKLLGLTEISDLKLASRANALREIVEKSSITTDSETSRQSSLVHVIRENLETAVPQSLTIETLVQEASKIIANDPNSPHPEIFPSTQLWSEALSPLFSQAPNPALGVMRPFAGSVFLVSRSSAVPTTRPARDINGYSVPLRMAMYTTSLLFFHENHSLLPEEFAVELYYLLTLTSELVNDQIDLLEDKGLFGSHQDLEAVTEVRQFLRNAHEILGDVAGNANSWRDQVTGKQSPRDTSAVVHLLISRLTKTSSSSTSNAYYASKALGGLIQALVSAHGWQIDGSEEWLAKLDILKTSTNNILGACAVLIGLEDSLRSSKTINTLCNRLISDVAGAKSESEKTLGLLVLLNSVLSVYDEEDLPVANNRVVFAVKQILSWTEDLAETNPRLASEACRTLQKLLPAIKYVYGTYWETAFDFCVSIWESKGDKALSNERLPMIGMSLKLYSILRNMANGDNDDVKEAFDLSNERVCGGLVKLLKLDRLKETQPLDYVDAILSREVTKIPEDRIKDLTDFYPLLASDFRMIQSAAFDVLHKALPKVQQELSVNVLLDGTTAQLPFELLSLLLNTPSVQDISEASEFPSAIRGYLLSWLIVYESYTTASLKVRNDYSELLKTENYIGPLLDFMFVILGHSDANPLNLERARMDISMIRHYDMWKANDSESSERNMNWLLVNLYYLCLNYTPGLVRTWWFSCNSRQTTLAVDSWTQKFFTPLVIDDTLEEVERWATNQEPPADDEKDLTVKVSKRSKEIFAGYEVDELIMQIVIRFPDNYPLEGVKVEGLNRVAVTEKKWLSWLRNTQGVITFSVSLPLSPAHSSPLPPAQR
ncbi:hypothetical protein ONS95_000946 [Cadophora gregata]|uniref:uncharacterized protein n=1 Tax=Cadophora gregata TaxID=51156 RepID=UPI0026DCBF38|nr:uncharacterized protein ONS95_000946 [Cadophora gregata]KAK0129006.1 hypothetical protein ONS95_000946 [Cadophora gregata]